MSTSKPFDSERELAHLRELWDLRWATAEKARGLASTTLDHRLDGMNLFRDQLRDQAARFVTREEVQLMAQTRDEAIQRLERRAAHLEGRLWAFGAIVALAVTALGAVPGLFGR